MLMSLVPIMTWANTRQTVIPHSSPVTVNWKRSCSLQRAPIVSKHLTNAISIILIRSVTQSSACPIHTLSPYPISSIITCPVISHLHTIKRVSHIPTTGSGWFPNHLFATPLTR
ncbi:hypothetical protein Bca4012_103099 [Brassica carinata]